MIFIYYTDSVPKSDIIFSIRGDNCAFIFIEQKTVIFKFIFNNI